MPALGAGAFRALDAPALALEFCELPFQLLEGIALVLQLRAQDAQALVPGFDFLIEFDLVGMADQANPALVDGRLFLKSPIFIGAVVDCLRRDPSGRGVRREVPVRDARPGGADLDQPPPRAKAMPLQDVYYQYSYFTPLRQPDLRAANVSSGGPCGRIAAADSRARAMLSFGGVAYVKGL